MRITTATLVGSSQSRQSAAVVGVVGKEHQAFRKAIPDLANPDAKWWDQRDTSVYGPDRNCRGADRLPICNKTRVELIGPLTIYRP